MKNRLFTFFLIVILALQTGTQVRASAPADGAASSTPAEAVSSENILNHIRVLQDDASTPGLDDRGTRLTGTPNLDSKADYIRQQLISYGLQARLVSFKPTDQDCGTAAELCALIDHWSNVVADLPGDDPSRMYVLMAHYDSINFPGADKQTSGGIPAPGANDNGSGVAVLLEAARVLSRSHFRYPVRFLFFTAEEMGLIGSKVYSRQARTACETITSFINVDMVGLSGQNVDTAYLYGQYNSPGSLALEQLLVETNRQNNFVNLSHLDEDLTHGSDHVPFLQSGYAGVFFGPDITRDTTETDPNYHSARDTLTTADGAYRLSPFLLVGITRLVATTVAGLAQVQSTAGRPIAPRPAACAAVVDDLDANFTRLDSFGQVAGVEQGYAGHSYYSTNKEPGTLAVWSLPIEKPGAYDVYVYIPYDHSANPAAIYAISSWEKTQRAAVDQSAHANQWVRLGNIETDSPLEVRLLSSGEKVETAIDAVAYLPADPPPLEKAWNRLRIAWGDARSGVTSWVETVLEKAQSLFERLNRR